MTENKGFPFRTCGSCEYTYWGGWKGEKACPKCKFGHYGALFVYGWFWPIEWIFKISYWRRKHEKNTRNISRTNS